MQRESNDKPFRPPCPEQEKWLMLYAAEELEGSAREEFERHLEQCAACTASMERERRLLGILGSRQSAEPAPGLLANCRDLLCDAIDEAQSRSLWNRMGEALLPARWVSMHPIASTAVLLLIGFSVGNFAPRWLRPSARFPAAVSVASPPAQSSENNSAFAINDQQLRSADIAGINWTMEGGNAAPQVRVQLTAEQPVVVQGTVDNDNVKRVLLYVLRNSQRFGPDVRLDSVELLKSRANDSDVQQALCNAARSDHNAAVRLKALEALSSAEPQPMVLETLLDALVQDTNPGVRIEAINTLRALAERGAVLQDPHAVAVLRDRMQKDSNTYIRLQSAAAIQGIGPREAY